MRQSQIWLDHSLALEQQQTYRPLQTRCIPPVLWQLGKSASKTSFIKYKEGWD
jgi:hypothetical protein